MTSNETPPVHLNSHLSVRVASTTRLAKGKQILIDLKPKKQIMLCYPSIMGARAHQWNY